MIATASEDEFDDDKRRAFERMLQRLLQSNSERKRIAKYSEEHLDDLQQAVDVARWLKELGLEYHD
jgi:hypothetical protein